MVVFSWKDKRSGGDRRQAGRRIGGALRDEERERGIEWKRSWILGGKKDYGCEKKEGTLGI